MPLIDFVVGLGFFLACVGGAAGAALAITRCSFGYLRGVELVLAGLLLFTVLLLAIHLIPLALGILSRETVAFTALIVMIACGFTFRARVTEPREPRPEGRLPVGLDASRWVAYAGVFAAFAYLTILLRLEALVPFSHIDVLGFHIPGVIRWIDSGTLWQIDQLFPYHVTGNYPNNGDVLTLAAILPWGSESLARPMMVPFALLGGLSTYGLAARCGARATTASLAGAFVVTIPAVSTYAVAGLPDSILLFGFGTGVLFLTRHWQSGRSADLVIAGLGLGLAFGTKWYGLTIVAAAVLVWLGAALVSRRGLKRTVTELTAILALVLLVGGIWLVRNLVESGNPLFPQEVSILGLTLFGGTEGTAVSEFGFTVVGYLGNTGVLGDFVIPGLNAQLGAGWVTLPLAALLAGGLALRSIRSSGSNAARATTVALVVLASLIALFWSITPGSAPGLENEPAVLITVRWLAPAALIAAAAVAAIGARGPRSELLVNGLLLVAILDALRNAPGIPRVFVVQGLATAVIAAVAVALAWLARSRFRAISNGGLAAQLGIAGAVALAAITLVRVHQVRFLDDRYSAFDSTFEALESRASGQDVGIAGESSLVGLTPILPAFGPDLNNHVEYIGPIDDGLLVEYEAEDAFVERLVEERYDLILIGRGTEPDEPAEEELWAVDAGYELVTTSDRLALYERPADA